MIDFKDPNLNTEGTKKEGLDEFLDLVLLKKKDRGKKKEEEVEEDPDSIGLDDLDSYLGGMTSDEDADGVDIASAINKNAESSLDETKKEKEKKKVTFFKSDEELEASKPYEKEVWWKNLLISPYFLMYFMIRSLGVRLQEKENVHIYLNTLVKVSGVVGLTTLLLIFFTDFTFIFSLGVQATVSILLFVVSLTMVKLIQADGIMDYLRHKDLHEDGEDTLSLSESNDGEESIEEVLESGSEGSEESAEEEFDLSQFDESEFDFGGEESLDESKDKEVVEVEPVESVEVVEKQEKVSYMTDGGFSEGQKSPIKNSPIDVNVGLDDYLGQLKQVYDRNERYRGVHIPQRGELLKSFSDYIIANDPEFSTWDDLDEDGYEYDNVMYAIYNGLVQVNNRYKDKDSEDTFMRVNEAQQNPLMYKIEVELPEYLSAAKITNSSKMIEFKGAFKASDEDEDVQVLVTSYQSSVVFKLFKPVSGLISLGDILRYHNETQKGLQSYEYMMSEKKGLPILLGLRGNEYPTAVDFADNTSMNIVGGSGSGKSWATFLVMLNLVLTNSYNDVNIVIMDKKKTDFWRQFSRLPHTIGYHTNLTDYFDILKELKQEMEDRKQVLEDLHQEDWKGLRSSLIENEEYEMLQAYPWLVIAVDEMTNTMAEVRQLADEHDEYKHIYEHFKGDLEVLAQEGRSLGVKLITIGQRAITDSIPKSVQASSSLKLFMKVVNSDYRLGFAEEELKGKTLPQSKGQALLRDDEEYMEPVLIRTLTLGGNNNNQISNLIRLLAFDWKRRAEGHKMKEYPGMKLTYNRDKLQKKVEEDLADNKMFLTTSNSMGVIKKHSKGVMNGENVREIMNKEDELPLDVQKEDQFGNIVENDGDREDGEETVKPRSVKIDMGGGIEKSLKDDEEGSEPVVSRRKGLVKDDNQKVERKGKEDSQVVEKERKVKEREVEKEVAKPVVEKEKTEFVQEGAKEANVEGEEDPFEALDRIKKKGKGSKASNQKRKVSQQVKRQRAKKGVKSKQESLQKLKEQRRRMKMKEEEDNVWEQEEKDHQEKGLEDNEGKTIVEYIQAYGEGGLTKHIAKEEIYKRYEAEEIDRAVADSIIFEKGSSYLV